MQPYASPQQEMLNRRLPVVIGVLLVICATLIIRLFTFQWLPIEVQREIDAQINANYERNERIIAARGNIYDRNGYPLAVNTFQSGIGVSPTLISDARETATQVGAILGISEVDIYQTIIGSTGWQSIARPVSAEVGQRISDLGILGITVELIPRRLYPQGALAAHVLGFVAGDGETLQGVYGVEGYYQTDLAGRISNQEVSQIPFIVPQDEQIGDEGADIVLTIDRDIQFLVESELLTAVTESGSTGGVIIVMNPRNGEILAMASYPSFDPNTYFEVGDETVFRNPAISDVYEPGSVMKVITVAGALELGVITPEWTYNDQGQINVGGIVIRNATQRAYGSVNTTQVLVNSLNVGAATISTTRMGSTGFYTMMSRFGIGQRTRIDLQGEEAGILRVPGDPEWSESDLGTNSFGQGVSVTPIQMATAVSAIANGGLMWQPHVVHQLIDGSEVFTIQPTSLGRPISAETARIVTEMMVATVNEGIPAASLPGYSVAGKTGTAQIASPLGYEPDTSIVTFVGFLPADDPQVLVYIRLDRPTGYWGSVVAAPIFRRLAERLVILLEIPPDAVRHALAAQGGAVNDVAR